MENTENIVEMKTCFTILSLLCVALLAGTARASDSEPSEFALYVADQCAASSGYPASNYLRYGSSLEKTISMLSSEQQARVFENLRRPHNAVNKAGKTNASGGGQNSQTALPDGADPTLLDQILAALGF
ncbi:MAG: hypothetical protein P1U87_16755 [Verrucomicrobiales bacterium]|nr:hypothetical protein [Verrucomicrobiales bacterium]